MHRRWTWTGIAICVALLSFVYVQGKSKPALSAKLTQHERKVTLSFNEYLGQLDRVHHYEIVGLSAKDVESELRREFPTGAGWDWRGGFATKPAPSRKPGLAEFESLLVSSQRDGSVWVSHTQPAAQNELEWAKLTRRVDKHLIRAYPWWLP